MGAHYRCQTNLEIERSGGSVLHRSVNRSRPAHPLTVDSDDLTAEWYSCSLRLAAAVREGDHSAVLINLDTQASRLVRGEVHPHLNVQSATAAPVRGRPRPFARRRPAPLVALCLAARASDAAAVPTPNGQREVKLVHVHVVKRKNGEFK